MIKPDDVYNLLRISLLMRLPLDDDPISRRVILPLDRGFQTRGGGADGRTSMPSQYFTSGGGADGRTSMPSQYFTSGGGADTGTLLTNSSMNAILNEYKSRVTSSVKISDGAKSVLQKHVEANISMIIEECKGRPGALRAVTKNWITQF
jgi:hypothetical protein